MENKREEYMLDRWSCGRGTSLELLSPGGFTLHLHIPWFFSLENPVAHSGRLFLEERVFALHNFLYFVVLFELNLHG